MDMNEFTRELKSLETQYIISEIERMRSELMLNLIAQHERQQREQMIVQPQ